MAYTDQFEKKDRSMGFMEHLDALRSHLWRSVLVLFVAMIFLFSQKAWVFDVVLLGPKRSDFLTYRWVCSLGTYWGLGKAWCVDVLPLQLVNLDLTGQLMQHFYVSIVGAVVLIFPYLIWEIWRFVAPALRDKEYYAARNLIAAVIILFYAGCAFGYFVLSPMSILFLSQYSVSTEVVNTIALGSYISTLTMMVLSAGLIFELPVLAYFLGMVGLINAPWMRANRRYAIVINLFIAAALTPSDVGGMLILALPMILLYEMAIWVVAKSANRS
ncbi:MAG: twin-arginine translocase subunit TatC [Sphingomonadales bacterium]|nr:twin-arginine translocase subunit TatC [Sphingomonadales bacterium]